MMNPARRLWLMVLSLPVFLVGVAAVNWLADPYGVWRIALIDRVYLNSQRGSRVMTAYRARTEQPTTLLVGSSRVLWGMPIEQGYRDGFLNASMPGASLDELAAIVRVALRNPRLQHLVWGVDFFSFDETWSGRDPLMRVRLEGDFRLMITETLLSTEALTASRNLLVRALVGRKRLPTTSSVLLPWPQAVVAQALDDSRDVGADDANHSPWQLAEEIPTYSSYRLSPEHVALFRDTVTRARTAGIDVIVFIGPMSAYELEGIRQGGQWDTFQEWKRQLLATQPYWDFSGYTELAYADHLFSDPLHYKPGVGQLLLRHLLGEDTTHCGATRRLILDSGVWVDTTSIDQHLARQEAERLALMQRHSRPQELVADGLRR